MSNQTFFKSNKHTLDSESYSTLAPYDSDIATKVSECLMVVIKSICSQGIEKIRVGHFGSNFMQSPSEDYLGFKRCFKRETIKSIKFATNYPYSTNFRIKVAKALTKETDVKPTDVEMYLIYSPIHRLNYRDIVYYACSDSFNTCFSRDYAVLEETCNNLEKIPIKEDNCPIL